MQIFAETERLLLRELLPTDAPGMFELDSDPEVHRYLGNQPVTTIEQSEALIAFVRQQYIDNGMGRWAVVEKQTGEFIGWAGLKLVEGPTNGRTGYPDLGYRFIRRAWGRGYATEAARASLQYGFDVLRLPAIYAIADVQNQGSNHVLRKVGLRFIEEFDLGGVPHNWYELNRPV
ncbi:GNAT family N-acetyltransferase [Hymenobacter sp. BT175]|uniref:GNAT family N-acetyltransferase n=1 Tax=Hymenobacter translucens TaxID=2886507 RepID=UPI001D0ED25C|nr:GNAT family N-acetyltransferase [Hymenobacter translucens]MCC2545425.1 GNAT family N-acetyltransferase [Hymenobacter translucens]